MSRIGYTILALLILALGWYVMRPESATAADLVKAYAGEMPARYVVRSPGLEQTVDGKRVVVNGIALAVDDERASGLWHQLQSLAVSADRVVNGVAAADFAAYGIDATLRSIQSDGLALSWGSRDGRDYVIDTATGRLLAVEAGTAARLDQLTRRLDAASPFPMVDAESLTAAGQTFMRRGGAWVHATSVHRPEATARVVALYELLRRLQLARLAGDLPATATTRSTLELVYGEDAGKAGYAVVYRLTFAEGADGAWWQNDGWPAQPLDPVTAAQARRIIHSFSEDRLFNIGGGYGQGIEMAAFSRGGKPWFSLESSTAKQLDDLSSRWDVVWEGGREYADPLAAERLTTALNNVVVTNVRPRLAVEEPWPDAMHMVALSKGGRDLVDFEWSGRRVRSATHVGTALELPELFADCRSDRFLNPVIANRAPERVIKLQRRLRDRQPPLEETFVRDERGTWQRSYPGPGPVDQVVLQRMVRAMAAGVATSVRFASDADRALADSADCEIAVRFAPKDEGKANDYTDLDETTAIDVGLAITKRDGVYRALNLGTGIAYDIDADLVQIFSADTASPLVVPLIPALVSRIVLADSPHEAEQVVLAQSRGGWRLSVGGDTTAADEVEVRRLLRDLAGLSALRRMEGTSLMLADTACIVTVSLPGAERDLVEQMLVQISRPGVQGVAADECVVFAESTRLGALVRNRAVVKAASVAGMVPDAARFRVKP